MSDGTLVKEIERICPPIFKEIDGRNYSSKEMYLIKRPKPEYLNIHTLTGLVDYCQNELEDGGHYVIHVLNEGIVGLHSSLSPDLRQRERLITAELTYKQFSFGREHDIESFIIAMQAQFVQDNVTSAILRLVGNLTSEDSQKNQDDGMTQVVTVKKGIVNVAETAVPNPVYLAPYRTFTEIEQPASNFVMRINKGPTVALHEADGGAWKNTAIKRIAEYLIAHLSDLVKAKKITVLS